jgi:hypothetical protein
MTGSQVRVLFAAPAILNPASVNRVADRAFAPFKRAA